MNDENLMEIKFITDEYWEVMGADMHDFSVEPKLSVGSLNSDLKYLKKSLIANRIISFSDFDRIASVLKLISEMKAPSA